MKYVKPEFELKVICSKEAISANNGLADWLESEGYGEYAQDHITTYEVNS